MLVPRPDSLADLSDLQASAGRSAQRRPQPRRDAEKSRQYSNSRRVLLLGSIRELALYRSAYLSSKGYLVAVPSGRGEALETIRRGGFDVVIVSYTLSNDVVLEYVDHVRQHCPECPIIAISRNGETDRRVRPDEIVVADEGPEALLAALQRLSRKNVQ